MNNEFNEFNSANNNVKGKKSNLVVILLVLIILCLVGYIVYDKAILNSKVENNTQSESKNSNSSNNDKSVNNNSNGNNSNNNVKVEKEISKDEIDLYAYEAIKIIGQSKLNIRENYNYLDDYNNKYELASSIALKKITWEDKDVNEEEVTGAFKVKLKEFKEIYKNIFNEEFDISKLVNDETKYPLIHFPVIKNDYLYGGYVTGMLSANSMEYKFVEKKYNQQSDEYELRYSAIYNNYEIETPVVENIGTLTIKLKGTDANTLEFVSMVITRK